MRTRVSKASHTCSAEAASCCMRSTRATTAQSATEVDESTCSHARATAAGSQHIIRLPREAELDDYAALAYRDGKVAIVSQASARVVVARIDDKTFELIPGSSARYRFPSKDYGNVEGVAW